MCRHKIVIAWYFDCRMVTMNYPGSNDGFIDNHKTDDGVGLVGGKGTFFEIKFHLQTQVVNYTIAQLYFASAFR